MKKLLPLLLVLALFLCACTPGGGEETTAPTQSAEATTTAPTESTTEPTEPPAPTEPDPLDSLRMNFPSIDGSTSLIPLEAGIRAAIFNKSIEEATLDVQHSTTWGAFWNVLNGSVSMIFSCPLSQAQWDAAQERGVELEAIPFAMEGFVFVVNAENPVDVLTQEQLRGIYSGEITNWSEVGGLDEEIIPYQRNTESGSQNYMIEFMGDTPLMDAPTELRPGSMGHLMDVIAINDNARGAIGYSVYAYAADMYGNGNEIKFIEVDGVAPSKATMAAGEYPLMGKNYAVFKANLPENSHVLQLVDWMLSFEGQLAIAQAGYVTVKDIGFDYEEMTLSKYQGVGTGPEARDGAMEYVLYMPDREAGFGNRACLPAEPVELENGSMSFRVSGLNNPAVLEQVHDFIDRQIQDWAWDEAQVLLKRNDFYGRLECSWAQTIEEDLPLGLSVSCTNGYLSVAVFVGYNNYNIQSISREPITCIRTETATWDLFSGRRLEPEELFWQGVDIDNVLNEYIQRKTRVSYDMGIEWDEPYPLKRDFGSLTTTGWHLTHDAIFIDSNNPFLVYGARISMKDLEDGTLVCRQSRDFSRYVTGDVCSCVQQIRHTAVQPLQERGEDDNLTCNYLPEDSFPCAVAINDQVRAYVNGHYSPEHLKAFKEELSDQLLYQNHHSGRVRLEVWAGRYAVFCAPTYYFSDGNGGFSCYYPEPSCLIFDLSTGEQIPWHHLLKPGWEDASAFDLSEDFVYGNQLPEALPQDMMLMDVEQETGTDHMTLTFLWENTLYLYQIPIAFWQI